MHAVHTYQILNHYTSREQLDPGFKVLDNSANVRPDWYEYWPIRQFLLSEPLDEKAFYGFLSPKFAVKTNLRAQQVQEFVQALPSQTDVALFSPSIHNSAYFMNVFEHGDAEHPGLLATAETFFARIGRASALRTLISDSRNTVHSNYFLAKPRFWRAWLEITEQIYAIAEDANDALGAQLRAPTPYRGSLGVQMKIFLMERVATWLLVTDGSFSAWARDPFAARSRIYKLPLAIVCDALKIAYTQERRGQYRDVFFMIRDLRAPWTLQIRISSALCAGAARRYLRVLKSYWARKSG